MINQESRRRFCGYLEDEFVKRNRKGISPCQGVFMNYQTRPRHLKI